jgi:hypothetical protein
MGETNHLSRSAGIVCDQDILAGRVLCAHEVGGFSTNGE